MEYVTEFKPRDVWDIGKPTMRGVRKCPKCGTMNGTRGLACKNKVCDMVFRSNSTAMKKVAGEACKLYTGTDMQIYSVRLSRDRGPDYRGFVLLPMVEGLEPSSRLEGEAALLVQSASRCYVEHCPRSQLKEMEVLGEGCSHILSCMSSTSESLPAMLRNSAMNDLEIRSEFKHEVYSFVEHISGPLVQRVNKQVFVVKCEADTRHPLGYLTSPSSNRKSEKSRGPIRSSSAPVIHSEGLTGRPGTGASGRKAYDPRSQIGYSSDASTTTLAFAHSPATKSLEKSSGITSSLTVCSTSVTPPKRSSPSWAGTRTVNLYRLRC